MFIKKGRVLSSPFFFGKFQDQMYLKKTLSILLFVILSSCTSFNLFKDNKFYYKNGYQRVQLDTENENAKNIHPVKI